MKHQTVRAALTLLAALTVSACAHQDNDNIAPTVQSALIKPGHRTAVWTTADRLRLKKTLDATFAPVNTSARNGFVVLASDGTRLYDRNGESPRTPASTLKVLTAATALAIFGPAHRFTTRIESVHSPAEHTLHDDLWLVGGGDPVFDSDDLHSGVSALAQAGLRSIDGRAMVDASAFMGPAQNPHWSPDDLNLDYAAGTSSLSLDGDVAIFSVQPTNIGAPAHVRLLPSNSTAVLIGSITTSYTSGVRIDHQEGTNRFLLSGTIAEGEAQRFPIPMGDVPHFVVGVFDSLLHVRGIATHGHSDVGFAPLGAHTLWLHRSPRLAEIVHHMLVVSDNHVAEQLLRLLGTSARKSGTEASGIAVERAFLTRIGVSTAGMQIYDGSGLAPSDRITPLTLASVLADANARPGSPLILGLPRVGLEGTVARHQLTAAAGRVRAKSGHISGVDGLVGVVQSRHHGPVTFAFIANDADDGTVEDAEDKVLDTISRY